MAEINFSDLQGSRGKIRIKRADYDTATALGFVFGNVRVRVDVPDNVTITEMAELLEKAAHDLRSEEMKEEESRKKANGN